MSHSDLLDYHKTLNLLIEYKYSIADIENMIPFEREIHIKLITNTLESANRGQPNIEAPLD